MKQRIGTIQSISNKPGIIILDEHLNGLDPEERRTVKEILKKMSNEAIILLSSHVLPELEELGGKILMLEDGHLISNSDIKDVHLVKNNKSLESYYFTKIEEYKYNK